LVINGVQRGDAETVTRALEEFSQAIQGMTDALKLMHGTVETDEIFYCIDIQSSSPAFSACRCLLCCSSVCQTRSLLWHYEDLSVWVGTEYP
jgi:hypothetical protein